MVSYVVGGFLFGIGMTLASGCGSRNLVRLGGGNLKSLVVLLFLALTAYMTMKGVLAVPRTRVLDPLAVYFEGGQDLPTLLHRATGVGRECAELADRRRDRPGTARFRAERSCYSAPTAITGSAAWSWGW